MLAPNEAGREPAPEPKPVEPKLRTITLTNRAPIQIVEDEWPEVAHGRCGYDHPGDIFQWNISIRVRRENHKKHGSHIYGGGRVIIHAKYSYWDENHQDDSQTVRVGRLLTADESARDLWKHILGVGDELRERIANEHWRKQVIHAVDACFANLPAQRW